MKYWINAKKDAIYAKGNPIWAWDVEFNSISAAVDIYTPKVIVQGHNVYRNDE